MAPSAIFQQHHEADHFRGGVEAPEWTGNGFVNANRHCGAACLDSTTICDLSKADDTRIGRQIYPAALYVPFQIEPFDRIDYARAHSGHTPFD